MNKTLATLCALVGIALATHGVQAASLVDGSADTGKTKAVTCGACHGATGNSVNPAWPNLAGQGAPYILDQDMADLAVFFESQPAAVQAVSDPSLVDKAEALYRGGDVSEQTAACIACHGPTGRGNPAASYPALAGQHAAYTAKQLRDYASGARQSDGKTKQMRDIASRLSEDEIAALASYIQGLR